MKVEMIKQSPDGPELKPMMKVVLKDGVENWKTKKYTGSVFLYLGEMIGLSISGCNEDYRAVIVDEKGKVWWGEDINLFKIYQEEVLMAEFDEGN